MSIMASDGHEPDLAGRFFFMFMRFEYALKASGYLKNCDGKAEPDWDRLARELESLFEPSPAGQFGEAVDYYLREPPKKQWAEGGQLVWKDVAREHRATNADWVLRGVRRVRNNLFHGGKLSEPYSENPERSAELIEYGMVILRACLDALPDTLGRTYHEGQQLP